MIADRQLAGCNRPLDQDLARSNLTIDMEKTVERLFYASRWMLAPIYVGLSLTLLALGVTFLQESFRLVPVILEITESGLVLGILLNLEEIENSKLIWCATIYMAFVLSAIGTVMLDRLTLKH